MFSDIITRIKLLFLRDKELYCNLRDIIGFVPHNIDLYRQALSHKSIIHRNDKGKLINNERLEFLGDAILGAVVGDIVFHHFPNKREGFLTTTRSKLVARDTLGRLAKDMGITNLILSSSQSVSHNSYIGGNALEALIGAIYLDRGYSACMQFVDKQILSLHINIDTIAYEEVNFKSKLLEWAQKNRIQLNFVMTEEDKDDEGNPTFTHIVRVEQIDGASGSGYSKKESQQVASRLTLDKIHHDSNFLDLVFASKEARVGKTSGKQNEKSVENTA